MGARDVQWMCSEILNYIMGWNKIGRILNTFLENHAPIKQKVHLLKSLGFPGGSASEEATRNAGDLGSIHRLGRFPGEGKDYPLQYSGLEISMDYGPWGHKESDTTERLSLSLTFHFMKYKVCVFLSFKLKNLCDLRYFILSNNILEVLPIKGIFLH